MKKRQKMIAMLLSLTVVFGLCGSEVTVQTAMAQEVQEDAGDESQKQKVQEDIGDESQKPEESLEDVSDQEVMEDSGQEEDTERTSQDTSETGQTETMQSTEENEPDPIEDTNQPQEQGEEEIEVQGTSEQPEEITEEQEIEPLSSSGLNNPKIEKDSSMEAGQKVTWDCVWFGKYPQAEVVPSADSYTAVDKSILRNGDIIENSRLYSQLQNASGWDTNNDITVDGNKYRRMKKSDATHIDTDSVSYNWSDSETYHYFKYEPIKWRVLKVNGNQALLLSDIALDDQMYNKNNTSESITWETSTIRSWLNGYGASFNNQGKDYSSKNFIGGAFSSNENSAIVSTSVVNDDNIDYKTEGGYNTTDKIFFLSESETYGDSAVPFGFVSLYVTEDEARKCKSSTYAKAMGTYFGLSPAQRGNCWWWLRSPGSYAYCAAYVGGHGHVSTSGNDVNIGSDGVRVALNLNLSSNLYTYAGTICSDGTMREGDNGNIDSEENDGSSGETGDGGNSSTPNAPDTSRPSKNPQTVKKAPVKVSKIKLSGISKKIAAGKKIKLTANITPSNAANKSVTWKSSNKKIATVNSKGVVTMNKKSGGKSVTITATAKDGSKVKAAYKITSMKGVVKKVAISGKKTVKAGKTLKLKAKVTASKKANKTLKWTSSNKKYATVSSSGKVKALKAGKGKKVKITAMATDGSGKKKVVTIKIK